MTEKDKFALKLLAAAYGAAVLLAMLSIYWRWIMLPNGLPILVPVI